eukprot:TRINITY_DN37174_c0_g1_i3.p1 TRINITY_DN37174_c0_g1~~TRINITY_DN37174_c0_g1_i3.p1  ORF type:complete len:349 (+),score=63.91 TRINITY_DN37174_c0_g1_i3:86-1132(+)
MATTLYSTTSPVTYSTTTPAYSETVFTTSGSTSSPVVYSAPGTTSTGPPTYTYAAAPTSSYTVASSSIPYAATSFSGAPAISAPAISLSSSQQAVSYTTRAGAGGGGGNYTSQNSGVGMQPIEFKFVAADQHGEIDDYSSHHQAPQAAPMMMTSSKREAAPMMMMSSKPGDAGGHSEYYEQEAQQMREVDHYDHEAAMHAQHVREAGQGQQTIQSLEAQIQELLQGQEALRYEINHLKMQVHANAAEIESLRRGGGELPAPSVRSEAEKPPPPVVNSHLHSNLGYSGGDAGGEDGFSSYTQTLHGHFSAAAGHISNKVYGTPKASTSGNLDSGSAPQRSPKTKKFGCF